MIIICRQGIHGVLMLLLYLAMVRASAMPSPLDKASFYSAMASNSMEAVDLALAEVRQTDIPEKTAYEGALLMKKAGLSSKSKEKMKLVKAGHAKLESAIKNDNEVVEYHFIRLMIQENAPKVVRYKGDLKKDAELVTESFKTLAPVVQQAIRDYSKTSSVLNSQDF